MTTQCMECVHYLGVLECEAFPGGIPNDILSGEFDHTEVHPKQRNEIVFEKVEE